MAVLAMLAVVAALVTLTLSVRIGSFSLFQKREAVLGSCKYPFHPVGNDGIRFKMRLPRDIPR